MQEKGDKKIPQTWLQEMGKENKVRVQLACN
jgi:hypothetical protein